VDYVIHFIICSQDFCGAVFLSRLRFSTVNFARIQKSGQYEGPGTDNTPRGGHS